MMTTLFYFIFALLLLVTFHEFGHFIVARLCGVKVLRFSFGFGRVLARYQASSGTEYVWSLWPIGGYVKMLDEHEGVVLAQDKPYAFNRQSVWKRILIVLAGPLFNFIFAFFALWLVWIIGIKSLAPVIKSVEPNSVAAQAGIPADSEVVQLDGEPVRSWRDFQYVLVTHIGSDKNVSILVKKLSNNNVTRHQLSLSKWHFDLNKPNIIKSLGINPFIPKIEPNIYKVAPDMPAAQAGLKAGDKIVALDGTAVNNWLDMIDYIQKRPNQIIDVTVSRNSTMHNYAIRTLEKTEGNQVIGLLGIQVKPSPWPKAFIRTQKKGPLVAMGTALEQTWDLSSATVLFIGRLITGKLSVQTISGPVGIAQGAGQSGRSGIVHYLFFLAVVSVSLGVLNLLPIPLLDGGHLLFYCIEVVCRRPVSPAFQLTLTYMGMVLLFLLMGLALSNDLLKIFS